MRRDARRNVRLLPALILATLAACQSGTVDETRIDAVATVAAAAARSIEPGLIFGANFGAWVRDAALIASTRDLVLALRPSVGRFPGGNISNNFCWVEQKVSGNDHLVWEDWSWGVDVAEYLAFLKTIGARPMFSLNPFDHAIDGLPHAAAAEAAELARLFVDEGFPGAFYEVGNENEGSWNPMLTLDEYADRFVLLARAVKAVDPSARLMGPVVSSYNRTWIAGLVDRLTDLGEIGLLDGISFHHYGGWISNANAAGIDLQDPQVLAGEIADLRGLLAGRALARVRIVVNELNAAIWDTGCTRDQFTIKQGLWLADALGVSLAGADAANVWIHLHPGTDPHALIDSETDPPRPTRNYWPAALAAQALSGADPTAAVEVLPVDVDLSSAALTGYGVRRADGTLGVILINKTDRPLTVAVDLPGAPRSATARRLGAAEYDAGAGPAAASVSLAGRQATVTVPAAAIFGLDIR